jgi:hypothetical protein
VTASGVSLPNGVPIGSHDDRARHPAVAVSALVARADVPVALVDLHSTVPLARRNRILIRVSDANARTTGPLFLGLATLGFVASAALHLATFTALVAPPGDGLALGLFAGAFVPLVAMLIRLRKAPAGPARWRSVVALVPPGIRTLLVGVVLYTLMNLVLSLSLTGGTTTEAVGDKRYLVEAGRREEISREEYDVHRRITVRLLTGHLLLFYLVPLIYFRFADSRLRERSLLDTS